MCALYSHSKPPRYIGWAGGTTTLVLSFGISLWNLRQLCSMHEIAGKRMNRYHELGQFAFGMASTHDHKLCPLPSAQPTIPDNIAMHHRSKTGFMDCCPVSVNCHGRPRSVSHLLKMITAQPHSTNLQAIHILLFRHCFVLQALHTLSQQAKVCRLFISWQVALEKLVCRAGSSCLQLLSCLLPRSAAIFRKSSRACIPCTADCTSMRLHA